MAVITHCKYIHAKVDTYVNCYFGYKGYFNVPDHRTIDLNVLASRGYQQIDIKSVPKDVLKHFGVKVKKEPVGVKK